MALALSVSETALDLTGFKNTVEDLLAGFLNRKAPPADDSGSPDLAAPLRHFLDAGGKRIRPILAFVGWHAAGATGDPRTVIHLAASLELFHVSALIHDDVMDSSALRRGRPTVHRALARAHQGDDSGISAAAAAQFGEGAAILIGDLAMVWSDELLLDGATNPKQLAALWPVLHAMRSEIVLGQYLDLQATGDASPDVSRALRIGRYKTAKYTVERPLHLGAIAAEADQHLLERLSAFALPLGEAFQLRDDLLGVFGDPAVTGKSALEDLRDGKATVLSALALQTATPPQRRALTDWLGEPHLTDEQAAVVRRIIAATGAPAQVEEMIATRYRTAMDALDDGRLPCAARRALRDIAEAVTRRTT
ncbi:polyprenyl synthetase family protein [Streptomyces sp. MB09-01]|uniref:polyprenyl synthetase family protein n=1 Tax=Streptomyces sp. MB09-01 TaxID=3028666 RepID=UPI0029AE8CC8|nr:polyprenyl synthetase family protein [Streptomyces sp. MB09-01]MDX3540927.1 polyprenyl synthetase family protein [Streptomyces sp. MB09-01]